MINEIFGEQYNGDEEVEFFPNEHFLDRQDAADRERITDTNFRDRKDCKKISSGVREQSAGREDGSPNF